MAAGRSVIAAAGAADACALAHVVVATLLAVPAAAAPAQELLALVAGA